MTKKSIITKIHVATGMRIGQLIYNAMAKSADSCGTITPFGIQMFHKNLHQRLFYIEDDELIEIVKKFIKELK